jgi:HEAT repeat protein
MRIRKLVVVILVGLVGFPAVAGAEPSKELKAELQGYVDATKAGEEAQATMYALMTEALIGGKEARKELAALAKDKDARVRLGAAMGLVLADAPKAVDVLVAELKDDPQLFLKLSDSVTLLPDDREKQVLEALLEATKPAQQRAVFRYLAGQYGALYAMLGDYLMSEDAAVRGGALQAALFTARDEAAEFASEMLESGAEAVRADGLKLAIGLTQSPDGCASAVAVLEGALKADSATIANQAARHLVKLDNAAGADFLGASLAKLKEDEKKIEVAAYLLENSARISDEAAKALMAAENEKLKAAGWQLAAANGSADVLDKLVEMFASTTFSERVIAVKALGRSGSKKAVRLLSGALFEGNRDIRLDAARGLARLGDPAALGALQRALNGERDREVKIAVVEAVAAIDTPKSLQLLRFQTTSRDPKIKLAVVRGIRQMGQKEGVKALKVVRNDRNLKIKWQAFLTTLELAPKMGVSQMERALRNPPTGFMTDIVALDADTRARVLEYLLRHGGDAARAQALGTVQRIGEPLFGLFRELVADATVDEHIRATLLTALAEKRAPADKSLFEKLARSGATPAIQHAALAALTEYGGKDLAASFRGLLGSEDATVKAQAAYGLAVINQ